jgi:O-methyltransferase
MIGSNEGAIEYKIGGVRRIVRKCLRISQSVMPKRMYDYFYAGLRGSYQAVWNFGYGMATRILHVFSQRGSDAPLKHQLTRQLLPHTMGGWRALHNAFHCVLLAERNRVEGCLVECGVARGGTAAMMAMTSSELGEKQRHIWMFDSFEGLPEPGPLDFRNGEVGDVISPLGAGDCVGTEAEVSVLMFDTLGFERSSVSLVKGWFDTTVPELRKKLGCIAVLRLDGDWYESTKVPLENLYDQISPGGFLIVDDYATCYGSRRAVDEFIVERNLKLKLNEDGRGGVWTQKI